MPSRLNRKLLREIADHIEKHPQDFNQEFFTGATLWIIPRDTVCKTPCCIGGLAIVLSDKQVEDPRDIPNVAQELLQITRESRYLLFGNGWPGYWFNRANLAREMDDLQNYSPTTYEAVIILRRMADDGYIWPTLTL